MKKLLVLLTLCATTLAAQPYKDQSLSIEERVEDLLNRMTFEEKVDYISGMRVGGHVEGVWDGSRGNERLGIAPFKIYHGPYGIKSDRYVSKNGTYYPVTINMAATWNRDLIEEMQALMGVELHAAGGHSNAGPAMNIIRDLRGGRSSEYFTEDPYLNGQMAVAYVKGHQSQGHFAIMKHYIVNNQERNRNTINVEVGERALREIYMPGYRAAVTEGGILGVMTGYNSVNGFKTCDNAHIIQEVLKDEWGFKGIVMTDWAGSGVSAEAMINAGLDFEMPRTNKYSLKNVQAALNDGKITQKQIDDMVRRVLYITYICGAFDNKDATDTSKIATEESVAMALKVAEEGIVLLQNNQDLLPLDRSKVKKVAVIGPNGDYGAHFREGVATYQMLQGGGSASITPPRGLMITPYMGIKNVAGSDIEVLYEPGCYGEHGTTLLTSEYLRTSNNEEGLDSEYFASNDLRGASSKGVDKQINFTWSQRPTILEEGAELSGNKQDFSARWSGKITAPTSRLYAFEIEAEGVARLYIDGKLVVNKSRGTSRDKFEMGEVTMSAGSHDIVVEFQKSQSVNQIKVMWDYGNDEYLARAVELAKSSDVVIMPVGTSGRLETEGRDRDAKLNQTEAISLSSPQERLIEEISKVNKNVAVVTLTAGVTMESWRDKVNSIIYAGFPGQEGGNALGSIIFGDVNPSGKLTISIPKSLDQYPVEQYSYTNDISYNEGIYVGYRYFDKNNLEPAFYFGHGLSYTTFEYSDLKLAKKGSIGKDVTLSVRISNSGSRVGKEVVQLYVGDNECSVDRPSMELKGFEKIELAPGESRVVEFTLNDEAFAFFSEEQDRWVVEPGEFTIYIGASYNDIRQSGTIKLK